MKIRNTILAFAAVLALVAAPVYAATLSGKVISVNENSITVMKDGQSTVYVLPPDLEIQARSQQPVTVTQLRGRTVTLTIDDKTKAQGEKPQVTNIRVDGDLEIDSDVEMDD